ncbi:methyltransferase domain-containing protein [Rhizobium ruizarguesonis]|jgi:ubiquinone/menaquinone biosynthesis C-methylase UbiE|uniref:Methyltransferase domain-containing protein n=1 Tax=Rhizobium ruizarguesonis TaxID=2081791 RepID=A0AAE5C344_9HYPH|nr:methyltransferase domain-containing protein [Rhizobium ruizarguesonis]NKL13594.1 methyltransferase domain-containing protein [Rhizobium leguminosarum bv. viciae]MCB2400155.1 methyltransferase domain-containing protein [Rhizobium ruizarguesonis]NEH34968.1 methyltransferase domain-containing protein [Rhizobium ruizarguesonis]NEH64797.1 methyltransferase domain-containing protein [Rhizobium ruizarguesonis]NEH78327.1 methyltransferase domain-containing protein [Rhizobium ruizarguesonis]
MDIEGGARAASASSLAPFEEGVAEFYDSLLVPILFEPYASEMAIVAERLKPGSILEVAAGTGALTRALRVTLDPATEIVATDLSQAMIDVGAPSLTMSRTHWMHADAQNLPFAPSMFDLVVCQFGVMFFPDKLKAYDEAKRVLRSGGRFLFTTWDSLPANDFARCVDECLASLFPSNPPDFLRNLSYSYFDIASIKAQMSSAGFDAISCDRIELTSVAAAHDIAAAFCQGTPLREEIESRAPARISEIVDEVAEQMESRHGVRPCGGMSAFVVVGRAS